MSTRPSILFVDDEERIVNQLKIIFRQRYDVYTATSGKQALEILQSTPLDVVVSDQRMPEMLGIELLSEVRKRSPVTMRMLLTGYSDLAAIVGSVNDGEVFRFINKPWDHEDIQTTIADAVAAGQAAREIAAHHVAQGVGVETEMAESLELTKVLLIDDSRGDLDAMAQVLAPDHTCLAATSVEEALKLLAQHSVGVIVTEARVGRDDTGAFLHLLKKHHPMITTVMLTRSSDADLVIRMINKAQIFRFATKPLRKSSFQLAVTAAMKAHMHYRANPLLVNRHRVAKDESAVADTSLVSSVLQSLSSLRARLPLWGRKRAAS